MNLESLSMLKEVLVVIILCICIAIIKVSKDYLGENDEDENDEG